MDAKTETLDEVPPAKVSLSQPEWPHIEPTSEAELDLFLQRQLQPDNLPERALGRMGTLALQLARIQSTGVVVSDQIRLDRPQLLVFAGDHGIADEGVSQSDQGLTRQRVLQMLQGTSLVNSLADQQGFALTVVDAGVASHILLPDDGPTPIHLLLRKIGYGTRNMVLGPAMSVPQAIAALHAGMDVVKHLPGNVLALGDVGVANTSCAALLLSRLCGVPLTDACGHATSPDEAHLKHKLEKLFAAASRHRKAVKPLDALAAVGGFEIAMMAGAMLQAASERRVVLVDGFVAGAAALVARSLVPAVADYLVFAHRSADPGHRLLLIHLQAQPLLDMELRIGQGVGALLAWPLLQAAQRFLAH